MSVFRFKIITILCVVSILISGCVIGREPELIQASRERKIDWVRKLLKEGHDVNIQDSIGMTPLMYSVALGQLETCLLLLDYGADKNIKDNNGNVAIDFLQVTKYKKLEELFKS